MMKPIRLTLIEEGFDHSGPWAHRRSMIITVDDDGTAWIRFERAAFVDADRSLNLNVGSEPTILDIKLAVEVAP